MTRPALFVFLWLSSCLCFLGEPAAAAGKKKSAAKPDLALGTLEKVLRAELAGQVDRRGQLAGALREHPDSAAARWQAGFVRDGAAWRSYDTLPASAAKVELLEQYRSRRADAPKSFAGQLDLANWCKKQGLHDQERAHLQAALVLSPDPEEPAVLLRLGYRQIGEQWISDEQHREWTAAIRRTEASLKKWSAKLEHVARQLEGNQAQNESAIAKLRAIADPSAIPAMELVLSGRDEVAAWAAVEMFKGNEGPGTSLALARQSVFSVWPAIRKAATAVLKERSFEDFVPALITLLATPAQGRSSVMYDPSQGALVYSYVAAMETENQFQVATFNVVSHLVVQSWRAPEGGLVRPFVVLGTNTTDSQRAANDALYPRERQRELLNDRIQILNDRVITVLADLSGREPTPEARQWWEWWYDYIDSNATGTKPVVEVSETEAAPPITVNMLVRSSCFAAGTPVWTETGPVPIETIEIGDRVLAQDIQSGELSYKPVLATSANRPKELLTLRFGDESIVCTKGHRFWISGTGWTMARELPPLALLHTVTGNTAVWSVKPAPAARTYNLVVDGLHTYFVGKAGILCQDLRRSDGANFLVPGLSREDLAQSAK